MRKSVVKDLKFIKKILTIKSRKVELFAVSTENKLFRRRRGYCCSEEWFI